MKTFMKKAGEVAFIALISPFIFLMWFLGMYPEKRPDEDEQDWI
jgi:hypothetical protein